MIGPRFALRQLRRDWRSGELRLLAVAVVLAVAAVTAVGWLAERVSLATLDRAADFLAADRVVETDDPVPPGWVEKAEALGLETADMLIFPSVVLASDQVQLVSVKAVEPGYPLRGELQVGPSRTARPRPLRAVPGPGEVWAAPRLLLQLGLEVGDTLRLGAAEFRIARVLFVEPDRGGGFVNLAPRVLMNLADVPATELVQPASRVRYRLLVAGPGPAVAAYEQWLRGRLGPGAELETPTEGQPGLEEVIRTAQRFLGLSALLTVIVGGVAMLLTIRRYAVRQLDPVAVMRCIGATQRQILLLLSLKLVWLGLLGGALGTALGFALHWLLVGMLAGLLPELPAPGWAPALVGLLIAQVVLLGFALPSVVRLRRVPPLRVLRRDLGADLLGGASVYPVALVSVFLLMWWQAGDLRLTAYVYAALLGTMLLLTGGAALLVGLVRYGRRRLSGSAGLYLAGVARRPYTTAVQVVVLGLGLMALLLLSVVRQDLLTAWSEKIPPQAPNYFLINVQPDQVQPLQELLAGYDVEAGFHPMVRAQLVAVNGEPVAAEDYRERRARRLVEREFNLSWATRLPGDNEVVAGQWWGADPARPGQWSIEEELAETLGLGLGDRLRFEVAGEPVEGEITSLRRVAWDTFNVNFFVVSPPGLLAGSPATYITSFYLPSADSELLPELVRAFPSVTVLDVNALLTTVRGVIDQGVGVVELMVVLTLGAGLVVLLAALQITREERQFEAALLRALGARRRLIRRLTLAEFLLVGLIAGALAGLGAAGAAYAMANELFHLDYRWPWALLGWGAVGGGVIVAASGALATRSLYRVSPMRLLQAAEER